VLSHADEVSIRHLHETWVEAEVRSDMDAVLSLCTESVRWIPPDDLPTVGLQAGRVHLQTPGVRLLSIETRDLVVEGTEDHATKSCRFETVFIFTETGVRGVARGTHVWTLEKQGERWRVTSVSWRTDPTI
jgi:ketosteroid isomerase-like protein